MKYTTIFIDSVLNDLKFKGELTPELYIKVDEKLCEVAIKYSKEFTIYTMAVKGSTFVDIQSIFNKSIKSISDDLQLVRCAVADELKDIIKLSDPSIPNVDNYLHIDRDFINGLFKLYAAEDVTDMDYISAQIMLEHVKLNSPHCYIIARQFYTSKFSMLQVATNFGIDDCYIRMALNNVCKEINTYKSKFTGRLKVLPYTEVSAPDVFNFCAKIGYPLIYTGDKKSMLSIDKLKLSVNVCSALRRSGIEFIYQLEELMSDSSKDWTMGVSEIGPKRKGEIETAYNLFKNGGI